MGGINGVVYNQSNYHASYLIRSEEIKLKKKKVEANAGVEARLSTQLGGSAAANLKYKCVENF